MAARPPNTPASTCQPGPRNPYHTAANAGAIFAGFISARLDILHAEQRMELMTAEPEDRADVIARLTETERLISHFTRTTVH